MLIPRTEVIQKVPLNYPPTYSGQILGRGRTGAAKLLFTRSSAVWCNILAKMENGTTLRYHPTHPWTSFPLPLIALCSGCCVGPRIPRKSIFVSPPSVRLIVFSAALARFRFLCSSSVRECCVYCNCGMMQWILRLKNSRSKTRIHGYAQV